MEEKDKKREIQIAAVDAWNKKFEFVKISKIFQEKGRRKKPFQPKHSTDFAQHQTYIELTKKCDKQCSIAHNHKEYRPIKIKFLGSKYFISFQFI